MGTNRDKREVERVKGRSGARASQLPKDVCEWKREVRMMFATWGLFWRQASQLDEFFCDMSREALPLTCHPNISLEEILINLLTVIVSKSPFRFYKWNLTWYLQFLLSLFLKIENSASNLSIYRCALIDLHLEKKK